MLTETKHTGLRFGHLRLDNPLIFLFASSNSSRDATSSSINLSKDTNLVVELTSLLSIFYGCDSDNSEISNDYTAFV